MNNTYWKLDDAPDLTGKVAIVTGANGGIGYETALALAGKNCEVILACRNVEKGNEAKAKIFKQYSNVKLKVMKIDTGSQKSVKDFAEKFLSEHKRLDLLINNAGIMMTPYSLSPDGIESQFAVCHVGHYLLTGLLLPLINQTPDARIVNLGSTAYNYGGIQFDDYNFTKGYDSKKAYGQAKTACIVFTYELQKRLKEAGQSTKVTVSHPGYSATNLGQNLPWLLRYTLLPLVNMFVSQPASKGALNILYAALGNDIEGGDFTGPSGKGEVKGPPTKVSSPDWTHEPELGRSLFGLSEKLTDYKYTY